VRASVGVAAGVAAFAATAVLSLVHGGGAGSAAVGRPGPEGVPIPQARPLARARLVAPGERIDGIACQAREQVLFHIHAHLTVFVRGAPRQVPAGIGIAPPEEVEETSAGAFVAGGACFTWIHTHAADGVVHIESPVARTYPLGDLFDVWGQPLDRGRVGPARGRVTAYVDGRVFAGNPRAIPLLAHAQIQLDVGTPLVAPERIAFPDGL
jgi:hypothetical protein